MQVDTKAGSLLMHASDHEVAQAAKLTIPACSVDQVPTCSLDLNTFRIPVHHAKNKIAGCYHKNHPAVRSRSRIRIIPLLVPGFWDKSTGICAGAMSYRRDVLATTRI